ncbi:MAG: HEPN domain-containing protein [Acidobacteria bacterium]|nr:HEPN domain-containing protein [Acidobacteriota bacterium]
MKQGPAAPAASPRETRLRAAIAAVLARLEPDQIILFGSAARSRMTGSSDLDLLVIRTPEPRENANDHHRWRCDETGDDLDVLLTDRQTAERYRRSAGYVYAAALEEGRTIYAREGAPLLRTGPHLVWNGSEMVRSTIYEPDYAREWLDQAERKWRTANREEHPVDKCENLQAAMERLLKVLIVAHGQRVRHRHDLRELWAEAEGHGESIPAQPDPMELDRLTKYAGEWQYPAPGIEPEATWKAIAPVGEDLLRHVRARVPALIEETRRKLERNG